MKLQPKVYIIGLGYIGLPTAALLASKGIKVTGVDVKLEVVERINRGEIHIVEPDLAGLVRNAVDKGNLKAVTAPSEGDVFLIAVPTPIRENKAPDLSFVDAAFQSLVQHLRAGNLVILESTSPVGTTEAMRDKIYAARPDLEDKIYIAYCPERVLPGEVIHELEHNDRIIGGIDKPSTSSAIDFYQIFVKGNLHATTSRTAEMAKLVENAYRDTNIAFANELSMICARAKIDIWELIRLANRHPRVNILQPGPGVGGHCIAVDPWFLVSGFPEESNLIRTSRETNLRKTDWVFMDIMKHVEKFETDRGRPPIVTCFGLAYKPDIDDLRESPSLELVEKLRHTGVNIKAVEPNVTSLDGLELSTIEEGLKSDIIVFFVAHREFKSLKMPADSTVLDYCGLMEIDRL